MTRWKPGNGVKETAVKKTGYLILNKYKKFTQKGEEKGVIRSLEERD